MDYRPDILKSIEQGRIHEVEWGGGGLIHLSL